MVAEATAHIKEEKVFLPSCSRKFPSSSSSSSFPCRRNFCCFLVWCGFCWCSEWVNEIISSSRCQFQANYHYRVLIEREVFSFVRIEPAMKTINYDMSRSPQRHEFILTATARRRRRRKRHVKHSVAFFERSTPPPSHDLCRLRGIIVAHK